MDKTAGSRQDGGGVDEMAGVESGNKSRWWGGDGQQGSRRSNGDLSGHKSADKKVNHLLGIVICALQF